MSSATGYYQRTAKNNSWSYQHDRSMDRTDNMVSSTRSSSKPRSLNDNKTSFLISRILGDVACPRSSTEKRLSFIKRPWEEDDDDDDDADTQTVNQEGKKGRLVSSLDEAECQGESLDHHHRHHQLEQTPLEALLTLTASKFDAASEKTGKKLTGVDDFNISRLIKTRFSYIARPLRALFL